MHNKLVQITIIMRPKTILVLKAVVYYFSSPKTIELQTIKNEKSPTKTVQNSADKPPPANIGWGCLLLTFEFLNHFSLVVFVEINSKFSLSSFTTSPPPLPLPQPLR
jgi:hypothetical protein